MGLIDRPRVAVLYGGDSNERDVSLNTGAAVCTALRDVGYSVTMIDPKHRAPCALDPGAIDVCFIALHGAFGEDGSVQQILDDMAIPYTGSGVEASRAAMDKLRTKKHFEEAGVRTPCFAVIDGRWPAEQRLAAAGSLGLPVIVKPAADGSSVGITKVDRAEQLPAAVALALATQRWALAEEFIGGPELTVGILHDTALPIIELIYKGHVFTRRIKYTPGLARHIIDPELPPGVAEEVAELALAAHRSLGCEGCTRVDLRLDEASRPWILEVNTIPGMTETSLIPDAARAAGISFPELCETIIEMALRDRTSAWLARRASAQAVGA